MIRRYFNTASIPLGIQAGILLGHRLGAGQGPKIPSLSRLLRVLLTGEILRTSRSRTPLRVSPVRRQPQGGVGFMRGSRTGKQLRQNDKPTTGQGDVAGGLSTTRVGREAGGNTPI